MSNEHNPVAHLITKIQQHWQNEITSDPECRLVRWLIQPDEARLFQGFLQLESTSQGSVSEMIVAQFTPFLSAKTFSADVVTTWLDTYEQNKATFDSYHPTISSLVWDPEDFRNVVTNPVNREKDLVGLLSNFHTAYLNSNTKLVLALMPQTVASAEAYGQWMLTMLRASIPSSSIILVFDFTSHSQFDDLFTAWMPVTKTVSLALDLDGATRKIAIAGNPLLPEIQFRQHLFQMSEAVQTGKVNMVHNAGTQFIHNTIKGGNVPMIATAHIVYAAMLFQFKSYDHIEKILQKGLDFARRSIAAGDPACKPLVTQFYGYLASNNQLNKKYLQAISDYDRQAGEALSSGLYLQAFTAWRQAVFMAKEYDRPSYGQLLEKAFRCGQKMQKEDLLYSDYCHAGLDYYQLNKALNETDKCNEINLWMSEIYGSNWHKETKQKANIIESKAPDFTIPAFAHDLPALHA